MSEAEEQQRSESPWKRIWRDKPDRVIELSIAAAILAISVVNWRNSKASSDQTDQLIAAAKVNAYAATQSVEASRNFAESARGINQGVSNAVGRLQAQANNTQELAENALQQANATRALASEAGRQADSAKSQADASKTIANRSTAQADATNRLATASDKSAALASKQLVILQKQLETSQRAWLSIVEIRATFMKSLPNAVSLSTDISFRNSGNLPATQVIVEPFVILADTTEIGLPGLQNFQKRVCRDVRTEPTFHIVQTVLPGATKHFASGGAGPVNRPTQVSAAGRVQPFVVGCITYHFSSSEEIHETGFIYGVSRRYPDGRTEELEFGKDVPIAEIQFSDFWDGEAISTNP